MSRIKNFVQEYEAFERPNLDAQHAIWEVHSVKAMGFFGGLLVASLLPTIVSVPWFYWAIGVVIFGGYPGLMAMRRMNESAKPG